METQSRVIPLTRREQRIVSRAREIGMARFGELGLLATYPNIARELAGLTDNERHIVFCELEDLVALTESFRGTN
jgi:hypothetical protein